MGKDDKNHQINFSYIAVSQDTERMKVLHGHISEQQSKVLR